jgi:integrase
MAMSFVYQVTNKISHNKEGSSLTHKARVQQLTDAAKIIDEKYHLKDLNNLKLKHITHVMETWKDRGLSAGTMKNRTASLRWLCQKIGKQNMLPRDNQKLGLEARKIDYNTDKGWTPSKELKADLPDVQRLHLELMRNFGMRFEEAAKFKPEENIKGEKIDIIYGTKGGRDREFDLSHQRGLGEQRTVELSFDKQKEVIQELNEYLQKNNVESLSRMYDKYKNFENNTRYIYEKVGITKEGIGTSHGLRHQYAQDRYEQMTGWKPPAQLSDGERREFRASLTRDMRELDRSVRMTISEELGHGRSQVTSNYVGSWK